MVNSLSKIRALPDSTQVWCAHEYTQKNLEFDLTIDPDNVDLQRRYAEVKSARSRGEATIPANLGIEKRTNPFLRWDDPGLRSITQSQNEIQTFARLRELKEQF